MISVIFRYGLLLALFLIVLDTTQRFYIARMVSTEIYVGLIALLFLIFGGWAALKLYQPIEKQDIDHTAVKILDSGEFSKREIEVLLFLCHGYTNKEIAEQLIITTNTVKSHLKNIYGKLGVSNRTQAAAEAKMLNIISS
ncbi:MAG: helix-turn-helix transcriptional regulator [Emcibacteraceae bacterium]|nr:helix-turn-helix transcriptional regulator [Emcibacteraceae bacterium]